MFTQHGVSIDSLLQAEASPYTGWGGFYYDNGVPPGRMKEFLIEAARNDIRITTITTNYFELFEEVDKVVPIGDKRWVVGHLNVITDDQARRLADLGVAMSTHTNRYIYKHGHLLRDELGPERENDIVPLKRLREAGVHVSLATDNVPTTLFYPIWHVVSRRNMYSGDRIAPEQALSREDALRCATIDGAWLSFEEDVKGSIETGKLADMAVLSADPLSCPEDDIKDIVAETTIVGGRVVYQRDDAS